MKGFLIFASILGVSGILVVLTEEAYSGGFAVFWLVVCVLIVAADIYYWKNRRRFVEKCMAKKRIKELEDARRWEERVQKIASTPVARVDPELILREKRGTHVSAGKKKGLLFATAAVVYFPIGVIMKLAKNYE